ncbi:MAG: hypothetical protein E7637_05925 [Ruminococcaceae bacterium]|nr:hypothetical protein [Oscillospiraceae bacterium]
MKKKLFRALTLLVAFLLLFSGCAKKKAPVMEYNKINDTYTHPKTKVVYHPAPVCYEATSVVKTRVIARLAKNNTENDRLYALQGTDTSKYLTTPYYGLFYADGIKLPALSEMNATRALFAKTQLRDYAFSEITDGEVLAKLVQSYSGEGIDEDRLIFEDGTVCTLDYTLKFVSKEYSMLNYLVGYRSYSKEVTDWVEIESASEIPDLYPGYEVTVVEENGYLYAVYQLGTDFLCDRITGNFYPIGDLLKDYHEQLSSEG